MTVAIVGKTPAIAPIMAIITGSDIFLVIIIILNIRGAITAPLNLARI